MVVVAAPVESTQIYVPEADFKLAAAPHAPPLPAVATQLTVPLPAVLAAIMPFWNTLSAKTVLAVAAHVPVTVEPVLL